MKISIRNFSSSSTRLLFIQFFIAQIATIHNLEIGDDSSGNIDDSDSSQRQGSWSHWWSYDGISGPDYWNINKRWRLCSLGRKQSPVDIRTERLVYDHLLGPLQLAWLPAQASGLNEGQKFEDNHQRPIKVQLLNSGRGIEVWLERSSSASPLTSPSDAKTLGSTMAPTNQQPADDQLILAKGPLSYAYKLYKIELHSSSLVSFNQVLGTAGNEQQPARPKSPDSNRINLDEEDENTATSSPTAKTSEHLINGHAFDGELQLHFYNKHSAASANEALRFASEGEGARPNLFATMSVFIQSVITSQHQQPNSSFKSPLDFILDNLSAIPNESNTIELQLTRKHLQSLVTTTSEYLTYQGSMNRPPCVESVDWILLNKALRVDSSKFAGLFEKLNTNQENIRPARPLNRRLLRTTINNLQVIHKKVSEPAATTQASRSEAIGSPLCQSDGQQNCTLGAGSGHSGVPVASLDGGSSCKLRPNYAYKLTNLASFATGSSQESQLREVNSRR